MSEPLPQGAVIGILGGGQLGRMLAVAAARLGYETHIYDPDPAAPAFATARHGTVAPYDDAGALAAFAESCAVVTYEFENIPPEALDAIEQTASIHPNRRALTLSRDRLTEKTFLRDLGLTTAPFEAVENTATLATALEAIGTPSILKTRTLGYDGKGQIRLDTPEDVSGAVDAIAGAPAILEGFVSFTKEISVIAARSTTGAVACYDPGENVHRNGILHTTTVPAEVTNRDRTDAVLLAGQILNALDYVGVMGVELFVTKGGLIVNEIAPRVHNSGHWTQLGCAIDQFEQHIRAITGLPLGPATRHTDVVMENLLGDDVLKLPALADENAQIHLYGKSEPRPGRKMGHINRLKPTA
ncbi:5-(carboxyamino)imidazole ribonucleotide synthase [Aestuariibius sp. 2305UL40-4]|uniref:5-(carboxyamino)imidazole ribonucleotide synthase n=1 Tax=Aestuariibius violaceus TaxID=3234132 RepID=UPI00345E1635